MFKEVTIVNTSNDTNDNSTPYIKTTLKNVRIAHYSESQHAGASHPREMVSITYSSILRVVNSKDASGRAQAPLASGFDLEQIRAL